MNTQQLMQSYPARFRSEKSGRVKGIFHFDISGQGVLKYTVQLESGGCKIYNGFSGTPNCVVQTDRLTMLELEQGKLKLNAAIANRRLTTTNVSLLSAFIESFRPLMIRLAN